MCFRVLVVSGLKRWEWTVCSEYIICSISRTNCNFCVGSLIEDFVFDVQRDKGEVGSRVLHCRNAPSPGATSSLAIAKMIADKMATEFDI